MVYIGIDWLDKKFEWIYFMGSGVGNCEVLENFMIFLCKINNYVINKCYVV